MSYLVMDEAPLSDTSKMIVSFWFRDTTKQREDPPNITQWPQDFWTEANASKTMVPPNAQYSLLYDENFKKDRVLFWNAYGTAPGGLANQILGDLFLGAAACWIPNPPPMAVNTTSAPNGSISTSADVDMSPFGIRSLLTFGDPRVPYRYCNWKAEKLNVMPGVNIIGQAAPGFFAMWDPEIWPPPYQPYYMDQGDGGKFYPYTFHCGEPQVRPEIKVPQSFIGLDRDGYLVINLQTSTNATFKGMAYELSDAVNSMATAVESRVIPGSYTQIGWPFPDQIYVYHPGYWNGYIFKYTDISQKIMGCIPESFFICGKPQGFFSFGARPITDQGWHHILFSVDISAGVSVVHDDNGKATSSKNCKAWLAVDDVNYSGEALQNRQPVHDGFTLPKLRGTHTTQILDCGPCTSVSRESGDNWILPRNAWLTGWAGNPKNDLVWYYSLASVITNDETNKIGRLAQLYGLTVGDFNTLSAWGPTLVVLYGNKPGNPAPPLDPRRPDMVAPDPKTFDNPSYSCPGFTIPINGHPIGVPCSNYNESHNTGLEMAELQIWVNKWIDTSDASTRRLFLDYPKDKDGEADRSQALQPVLPSVAASAYIGKDGKVTTQVDNPDAVQLGTPDILLHRSGNWKTGRNTGTAGITTDADGNVSINSAGQFRRVAVINKFVPNPKLGY